VHARFSGYAPKIDLETVFEYNIATTSLKIKGVAGIFPAFEGYAQINGGSPVKLFQLTPEAGSSPVSLLDLGLGIIPAILKQHST
jgi:hypothetical protein